jgi:hypothetical protein
MSGFVHNYALLGSATETIKTAPPYQVLKLRGGFSFEMAEDGGSAISTRNWLAY